MVALSVITKLRNDSEKDFPSVVTFVLRTKKKVNETQ